MILNRYWTDARRTSYLNYYNKQVYEARQSGPQIISDITSRNAASFDDITAMFAQRLVARETNSDIPASH